MKILIIILSCLSERYFIHAFSSTRFHWFSKYVERLTGRFPQANFIQNPYIALLIILLPILFLVWILFALLGTILFGFVGFLLSFAVFYYCLGPENPFYPLQAPDNEVENELAAGDYFAKVNNQLFGVIFWFLLTGPLGVLLYRLISLCVRYEITKTAALKIISILDWIPTRITLMLYLLVGNFQQGFTYYRQMIFAAPSSNTVLLSTGGLLAARNHENEVITLPFAQNLVSRALIVYVFLIALLTLSAWL